MSHLLEPTAEEIEMVKTNMLLLLSNVEFYFSVHNLPSSSNRILSSIQPVKHGLEDGTHTLAFGGAFQQRGLFSQTLNIISKL